MSYIDLEERDIYKTREVIMITRNLLYTLKWDHRTMINCTSLNSIAAFVAPSFLQNIIQRHIQRCYM